MGSLSGESATKTPEAKAHEAPLRPPAGRPAAARRPPPLLGAQDQPALLETTLLGRPPLACLLPQQRRAAALAEGRRLLRKVKVAQADAPKPPLPLLSPSQWL